ncbi:Pituitary tumor-transforming gene 1 protein-interacting protein [Liparis tanakae]|uniref:Pituitary tumor-transforming gene 1 protein-interacting protein n=1 Tax=Liparis tanakae TaxID=230148 RepID=A0A4Z2J2P7_9TELE|nr:Pituitary tumor-transforming gene 1 protein-interacting protein [Liparis tanakae]
MTSALEEVQPPLQLPGIVGLVVTRRQSVVCARLTMSGVYRAPALVLVLIFGALFMRTKAQEPTSSPAPINFQILIITMSVLGGVIIIGIIVCCCCCCKCERIGRTEMHLRHDEIRQKYGMAKDNPYARMNDQ